MKFKKIHRIDFDLNLLGRNQNILHILFDGNQGACLNIVIPAVLHQIFDGFPGPRKALHFIKNNDRPATDEVGIRFRLQAQEEKVHVIQVIEAFPDILSHFCKIQQQVGIIFVFCKLFGDCRFSDPSGPFKHGRIPVGITSFPIKKFLIGFSFKVHRLCLRKAYYTCLSAFLQLFIPGNMSFLQDFSPEICHFFKKEAGPLRGPASW